MKTKLSILIGIVVVLLSVGVVKAEDKPNCPYTTSVSSSNGDAPNPDDVKCLAMWIVYEHSVYNSPIPTVTPKVLVANTKIILKPETKLLHTDSPSVLSTPTSTPVSIPATIHINIFTKLFD